MLNKAYLITCIWSNSSSCTLRIWSFLLAFNDLCQVGLVRMPWCFLLMIFHPQAQTLLLKKKKKKKNVFFFFFSFTSHYLLGYCNSIQCKKIYFSLLQLQESERLQHELIYSLFGNYLLQICHATDTITGTRDAAMKKNQQNLCPHPSGIHLLKYTNMNRQITEQEHYKFF